MLRGLIVLIGFLVGSCSAQAQCQPGYAPAYQFVAYSHNVRWQVICVLQYAPVSYAYVPDWSLQYPSQWDYELTAGVPMLEWPQQPIAQRAAVYAGPRTWAYDFPARDVRPYRWAPHRVIKHLLRDR